MAEPKRPVTPPAGQAKPPSPTLASKIKFDFIGNRNIAFAVSIASMVFCWIWVAAKGGLSYGVDFTGGIVHVFKFNRPSTPDLLSAVREAALDVDPSSQVQNIGKVSEGEVVIQVKGFELVEKARAAVDREPVSTVDDLRKRLASFPAFDDDFYRRIEAQGPLTAEAVRKAIPDYINEVTAARLQTRLAKQFGQVAGKTDLNSIPEEKKLFQLVQREAVSRLTRKLITRMADARATSDLSPILREAGADPKPFEAKFLLRAPALEELQTDLRPFADKPDVLSAEILKMYPFIFSEEYMPAIRKIITGKESRALYASVDEAVQQAGLSPSSGLGAILNDLFYTGSFVLIKTDQVSSRVGAELRRQAALVVTLSLLAMLAYVWVRFEFRYGIGAIITLFHDSMTMIPLMSVLGYEYDINLIAAILTLIGYSLNDTIVVYDRIRENMAGMRGASLKDVINTSIVQTLSRTVVTGVTTLLAVLALYFLGGPVLEGLSLTLFIGILVGTYSSIFVSAPVVYLWPGKK